MTDSTGQVGFEVVNEPSTLRVGDVLGALSSVGRLVPVTVVEPAPQTVLTLTDVTTSWTSFTPSVVMMSMSIRYACLYEASFVSDSTPVLESIVSSGGLGSGVESSS